MHHIASTAHQPQDMGSNHHAREEVAKHRAETEALRERHRKDRCQQINERLVESVHVVGGVRGGDILEAEFELVQRHECRCYGMDGPATEVSCHCATARSLPGGIGRWPMIRRGSRLVQRRAAAGTHRRAQPVGL